MDSNIHNDCILAARIKDNDLEAFETLFNRYKKRLYFFSIRYLSDHVEAEEVVQTVFISVWEHRKSLDESKSVKSYIFKSAVNLIYNFLKKEAVRRKYLDSELRNFEKSANQTYDNIFRDDLEKRINIILSSMPPQQHKIFTMSRSDGYSIETISKKLGVSVRTVENQIYRASKLIKENLKSDIFLIYVILSPFTFLFSPLSSFFSLEA